MDGGALLMEVGLGALAPRLLLGDPGPPLGRDGALRAQVRLFVVVLRDLGTALLKLALAGALMPAPVEPRQQDETADEHDGYDDDCDDQDGYDDHSLVGAPRIGRALGSPDVPRTSAPVFGPGRRLR